MSELMKRYEAETGKSAITVDGWGNEVLTMDFMDWKDNYIIKLRAEAYDRLRRPCDPISLEDFMKESSFAFLFEKFMLLQAENAKLKDQLRWRPVSEKPKNEGMYFARWHDDSQPVVLRYIKYVWFRYDYELGDYASVIEPKWWLPIPPAPEGE